MQEITAITPSVCRLMGITPPALCDARPLPDIERVAESQREGRLVRQCLIYCPDAIGLHLCEAYASSFQPVLLQAPTAVTLRSVFPPKTPMCFASMFTGALPEAHGITTPVRRVLTCDTLFDALIRSQVRVATVATQGSSIDLIFRGRAMDYYSEPYDPQVTERALELIAAGRYDVLVVYHQAYDDALHKSGPRSDASIAAMLSHIDSFARLAQAFDSACMGSPRAVFFCPDHGGHASGHAGTHGEDIPKTCWCVTSLA